MRHEARAQDVFARIGGEEFILLFDGLNAKDAAAICERIRLGFGREGEAGPAANGDMSVSFGVVSVQGTEEWESTFKRADAKLYEAKSLGRNRICVGD
jgi:diguanylate cyclase (GGDEF)-like protein